MKKLAVIITVLLLFGGINISQAQTKDCEETIYDKGHEKNIKKLRKKWEGQKFIVLQKKWGGSSYSSKYTNTKHYNYKNICGTDYYLAVSYSGQGLDAWVSNIQYIPYNNIPK
ncbi:hypothetical protein [Fulvivirga lutea]|uniref:Uncharacterized protein n=1 Tax=Fulvivirga lutea TaxID=2810512 RepID=A0A974WH25_9BACT|nr:hypothetical protein [Fulvivirga lutea]QSE97087.1 hypothetical protein JR347_16060 [Fulvivirga lutea]